MIISLFNWLLGSFLSFVLLYKYLGLFVIAFIGALVLPVPSSTTLAATSAFASQGYLSFPLVLGVALAGNILGDAIGYLLAYRFGQKVLSKIGFARLLNSPGYHKLQRHIENFSASLIYFTRFLTEVGPAVNILSGITKVPARTFFIYDILGETSYVLLYGAVGYFLGSQWENNIGFLAEAGLVMASLGFLSMLIQVGIYRRRHKKN